MNHELCLFLGTIIFSTVRVGHRSKWYPKLNTLPTLSHLFSLFHLPLSQNKSCRFMNSLGMNVLDFHLRNGRYKESCKKKNFLMTKAKNKKKSASHVLLKAEWGKFSIWNSYMNFSQDSVRLIDSMKHAKGRGWSSKAALLIGLPLCTRSVWPRKIERHSIANWGRGQNKMITKNTTALKQKYNQFF